MQRTETAPTTIRLPPAVRADVERIAREEDRTLANTLRRLIAAGIAARRAQRQAAAREMGEAVLAAVGSG